MDEYADAHLARRLATEAGSVVVGVRRAWTWSGDGDQRVLRAAADQASEQFLAARLAAERPDDAVLSEEAADDLRRLTADRVWIVDPLDGTREFAEGRSDWAVHVALWRDGDLVAGAVALPDRGPTLCTDPTPTLPERSDRPIRIAVSRSRPPALVDQVAGDLGAELVPMGSAGYKAASVIFGEVDAYVHAGGQYEWDSAAPVAVARAAGLHASRLDGSPLRYNMPEPYLPDLLICRPELADALLAAVNDNVSLGPLP